MTTQLNQQDNIRALAVWLQIPYNEAELHIDSDKYCSVTYEEAYEQASDCIKESLWAFSHSFISDFSDVAAAIPEDVWNHMVSCLCESFNPAVAAMLDCNLYDFISAAISDDGLGHFLSTYDGNYKESNDVCKCNLDANYFMWRNY